MRLAFIVLMCVETCFAAPIFSPSRILVTSNGVPIGYATSLDLTNAGGSVAIGPIVRIGPLSVGGGGGTNFDSIIVTNKIIAPSSNNLEIASSANPARVIYVGTNDSRETHGQTAFFTNDLTARGFKVTTGMVALTNDVTVTNTTSETSLIAGAGLGTFSIPANFMTPGMTFQIHLAGKYSTPVAPGVDTLSLKLNSTIIASNVSTFNVSLVNEAWSIDATMTCRLTGASGTIKAQGVFQSPSTAGGTLGVYRALKLGTTFDAATIDTTATQTLDVVITPGTTTTGLTTTEGWVLVIPNG